MRDLRRKVYFHQRLKAIKCLLKGASKNVGWPRLSSLHCNNVSTHVMVHATWSHFFVSLMPYSANIYFICKRKNWKTIFFGQHMMPDIGWPLSQSNFGNSSSNAPFFNGKTVADMQ